MMGSGAPMGWMWLLGALVVVAVVVLAVLVAHALGGGAASRSSGPGPTAGSPPAPGRARQILDERYARGELTTEEYQERLRVLGDDQ